jgi:hypothetical protein
MRKGRHIALWPEHKIEFESPENEPPIDPRIMDVAWCEVFDFVALGWYVAPPIYHEHSGNWVCVGYNVRGSLWDPSYKAAKGPVLQIALGDLALLLSETVDADCVRGESSKDN